jgi:hypothetical protein
MTTDDGRIDWIAVDLADNPFQSFDFALQYWSDRKGDAFAPTWPDIDLMDFPPKMIANCNVTDIGRDPLEIRYRFFGTGICNLHGSDLTGKTVEANEPAPFRVLCIETFTALVERREPLLFIAPVPVTSGAMKRHHFLRLPLSADGVEVTNAITFEEFAEHKDELKAYYARMA